MRELWKDISGYKGYYQVSTLGRVKAVERVVGKGTSGQRVARERVLKARSVSSGYLIVALQKEGKRKEHRVHRLVAEAFIPNPYKLPYVNHLDFNVKNNHFENLEWCTPQQNSDYSSENMARGESIHTAQITEEDVRDILYLREQGLTYQEIADKFGIAKPTVGNICRRETWKHLH